MKNKIIKLELSLMEVNFLKEKLLEDLLDKTKGENPDLLIIKEISSTISYLDAVLKQNDPKKDQNCGIENSIKKGYTLK